ncbi:hypothetical protein [Corallococcus sp. CA054B]|uniref:hypothetical protein n=1 Tax=Corallococcus sp. CA054B TaxID=2316734 RepID=UPI000EA2E23D|nr:hypothetical protein [Corallococcus sp. CA054B]
MPNVFIQWARDVWVFHQVLDLLRGLPRPPLQQQRPPRAARRPRPAPGPNPFKTTGVKRIAVDVPAPAHRQPVPERIPTGGAVDLQHLAQWNFRF